jgi:hypothetical protein
MNKGVLINDKASCHDVIQLLLQQQSLYRFKTKHARP